MGSSTRGRGVRFTDAGRVASPQDREGQDDGLERWHDAQRGNYAYLAIFAAVSVLTVAAVAPVWLLLQARRAVGWCGSLYRRLRGGSDRHRAG